MRTRLVILLSVFVTSTAWSGLAPSRLLVVPWAAPSIEPALDALSREPAPDLRMDAVGARGGVATGETVGVAALIETDTTLYAASTGPLVVHVPPDGSAVDLGGSGVDGGLGQRFSAQASYVEGLHPIPDVVTVTVTSEDSFGAPTAWIPSGVALPGGEVAKVWRFDAGALEAVIDPLVPNGPFAVRSAVVRLHDSLGDLIVSFDLGWGTIRPRSPSREWSGPAWWTSSV